ncbi:MAG: hypothetical protein B5M53_03685 [Candidatus Cloacimonas sp. 4484_209]|nr:MAG: hypothetical protein B5M53_03685 [Candidatus Cloacimonas sp. 4484_209]
MAKKKKQQKVSKSLSPIPSQSQPSQPAEQGQIIPLNLGQILKDFRLKTNKSLIQDIMDKRNGTPLLSLVLTERAQLMPPIILPIFDVLKSIGKKEKLDLFLSSTGGATEVPWRIVSLIREFCKSYSAIIPFAALSAGTHIALGADSLLMSEISTLGPVDPTTRHPLQPLDKSGKPVPVSVEDLKNCIKFITQQLKDQNESEKYSPTDMTEIVGKFFEHIEPLTIGAVERSYALSRLITRKVLETHLDSSKEKQKIDRIVDKIGGEYFSHAFPITRRDVEQELQLKVEKPDNDLFEAIWRLHTYYGGAFSQTGSLGISMEGRDPKGNVTRKDLNFIVRVIGYIDSLSERRVLVQLRQPEKDPKSDTVEEKIIFTGWIKPNPAELSEQDRNFFLPTAQNPPSNT